MSQEYFVVAIMNNSDPNEKTYLYHDPNFGYVMGGSFRIAKKFTDFDKAKEAYDSMLAEKPRTYTDGTIYPPDYISHGLSMRHDNPKVSGTFTIEKVMLFPMLTTKVEGEIKRPTPLTAKTEPNDEHHREHE